MTRRERLERKLEKRQQWAESRREDAARRFAASDAIVEHIPMGQPILIGHHSERGHRAALERSHNHMHKGCESMSMAAHHESKADGIERQLERSIFSDDDDAIEAIEAKLASLEAKRDRMKKINAAHTKFVKNPASLDKADLTDEEKEAIRNYKPAYSWEPHPFPPYSFQNLGGNIRRYKQRIEHIKARNERSAKAEAAGGVVIEEFTGSSSEYCRITFAEKPDRSILDALKAAGFYWGSGSWSGKTANIPDCVKAEVQQ